MAKLLKGIEAAKSMTARLQVEVSSLKEQGITTLIAQSDTPAHYRYLDKMGFKLQGEERIKSL